MNRRKGVGWLLAVLAGCNYHVTLEKPEDTRAATQIAASGGPALSGQAMTQDAAGTGAAAAPVATPSPVPKSSPTGCTAGVVSRREPCNDDLDPCHLSSGFAGDQYCLLPPAADEGVQVHLGPSDYKDATSVEPYLLNTGAGFGRSLMAPIPLTKARLWSRIQVSTRPSMHHWAAWQVDGKPGELTYDVGGCSSEAPKVGLAASDDLIYDNPPAGVAAPENKGLGFALAKDAAICVDQHADNSSDQPQLAEMWINFYFIDEPDVTQRSGHIALQHHEELPLVLAAGAKRVLTGMVPLTQDGRIVQLFAYEDESLRIERLRSSPISVWLNDELIYSRGDAHGGVLFNFDSVTTNPPLVPTKTASGARSGPIQFHAGDTLRYECVADNSQSSNIVVARTADGVSDLCNLWGLTVGPDITNE